MTYTLNSNMLLTDQFYFIAHEERAGNRRLSPRAVGLGLSAALLGELLLLGHIGIYDNNIYLNRKNPPRPPPDTLNRFALSYLINQPQHSALRTWLAFFAETTLSRVCERLVLTGNLREIRRNRWLPFGSHTVYLPTNSNVAGWQAIRLERLLNAHERLPLQDALLTGLVSATGLLRHVLWHPERSAPGLDYAKKVIDHKLPSAFHTLVTHTEAAVGQTVLAPR